MALSTFSYLRQRFNYLIGDTSSTTSAIGDSHLNASIIDICNAYPFSWTVTKTTGSITGSGPEYSLNLAADLNIKWGLLDARIVGSQVGDDHLFEEIPIPDRDQYAIGSYKWWRTYGSMGNVYVFNTKESSGTLTYYYYTLGSTLVNGADVCFVPDPEAVCLLAASKNWITDERNQSLSERHRQDASVRIQSLWQTDNAFGPQPSEGSVVDYNPSLIGR